jgi:hypothetical protein
MIVIVMAIIPSLNVSTRSLENFIIILSLKHFDEYIGILKSLNKQIFSDNKKFRNNNFQIIKSLFKQIFSDNKKFRNKNIWIIKVYFSCLQILLGL